MAELNHPAPPRKACCDEMRDALTQGFVTAMKGQVILHIKAPHEDYVDSAMKSILFCPWCGFRLKVRPK